MTVRWMTILCLFVFCAPSYAQRTVDAKTLKKIKQEEETIAAKKKALEEANRNLQDDFAQLRDAFDAARGGDRKIVADLRRVLDGPIEALNKELSANRSKKRIAKGFSKVAKNLANRVESPILVAFGPKIQLAAESVLKKYLDEDSEELDTRLFARDLLAELMPQDVPFWQHWNGFLYETAKHQADYAAARESLRQSEEALLVLRDPKMRFTIGAPKGMALITGGSISIESEYGFKTKKRKQRIRDFYIDLKEVTHGEYWKNFWIHLKDKELKSAFVPTRRDRKGIEHPQWIQDPESGEYVPLEEIMDRPVTGINARAARAYAESQGKRLPTEAEWIAAATATPGKTSEYPYGDKWAPECANDAKAKKGASIAVGSLPRGRSFYGVYDMAGNVKELTWTLVSGKEPKKLSEDDSLVLRGGSFDSSPTAASLKWRWKQLFTGKAYDVGFRCAKSQ